MNQVKSARVDNVAHVIAVASGKGGVGKSTTAVNLALALQSMGHRVGLLDADIYGPSVPAMLGIKEGTRPDVINQNKFKPIEAHGLQTLSMANLTTKDTPTVWRGPMASGALQQIITQTAWDNLEFLIVDMPPGTGDIQLTLAQRIVVDGAVVVTTPQDIALLDAIKGIEMFRKVSIPVLGIVENMSVHICQKCGHVEHIFGDGGANPVADHYTTPLLGQLPLQLNIRKDMDAGTPTVVQSPDSAVADIYRNIATKMIIQLESQHTEEPDISFE